jgi:transaldolase
MLKKYMKSHLMSSRALKRKKILNTQNGGFKLLKKLKGENNMNVKIFSDGADKASMLEMAKNPGIQGLTTNPTLMKKAGITDYRAFCKDILAEIKDKPISFEVFSDGFPEMKRQALEIASWGQNVYVKIPITNSEGLSSQALIKELAHANVKLNVTAILTWEQIIETVMNLKGAAPSIVSVFAGRIADTGRDPIPMMTAAAQLCRAVDKNIELLWASSREVLNVVQADQSGCHIITATPDLIKKTSMFNKDLKQLSLETVRMFKADAESAGFQL